MRTSVLVIATALSLAACALSEVETTTGYSVEPEVSAADRSMDASLMPSNQLDTGTESEPTQSDSLILGESLMMNAILGEAAVSVMNSLDEDVAEHEAPRTCAGQEVLLITLDESVIDQIAPRPLLMIATTGYDMIHPIDQVLDAFESAKEPKRLALLPYGQTGLYTEPGLSEAMAEAVAWFEEYL